VQYSIKIDICVILYFFMLQNENTSNIHNINCDWDKYPMVSIKDYYSNNFNDIIISEHLIEIL
jgi:hypothetical protein